MTIDPNTASPVVVAALTLWGEARGLGVRGMHGVMNVIANRVAHPGWWGDTYSQVCLRHWQFSCWNFSDPNRAKLLMLTASDENYVSALGLAWLSENNQLPDITEGADSYYDTSISPPDWAADSAFTVAIGNMRFYRVR